MDVAEELTQETFTIALRKWDKFQGGNIYVWLCQIAKLEFYSWYRKNKKIDETSIIEAGIVSNEKKLLEQLIDDETRREVLKVLQELSEPYKTVLILHIMEEMTLKSISSRYKKSESWGKGSMKKVWK